MLFALPAIAQETVSFQNDREGQSFYYNANKINRALRDFKGEEIVEIYQNYDWTTEILVASVRHPIHVTEAARLGADVVTMGFKILDQMFKHPLTDKGIDLFLADWKKVGQ